MSSIGLRHFIRILGVFGWFAWANAAHNPHNPQPDVPLAVVPPDRPYELRVLYLNDARWPALTVEQRQDLHARLENKLLSWYGYKVKIREVGVRDLAKTFAALEPTFTGWDFYRIDIDPFAAEGKLRLQEVIRQEVGRQPLSLIQERLQSGPLQSREQAEEILARRFIERLTALRNIRGQDGHPLYSASQAALFSYAHWCAFLHDLKEADLVFTNLVIAGADVEMPLNVMARGGVTLGITNANRHNAYEAASVVSLFPFLADGPFWRRDPAQQTPSTLVDVVAVFTMHEMGHFFLRRADCSDHPHCVQVPPPGLEIYRWYRDIIAQGPCTLPHEILTSY